MAMILFLSFCLGCVAGMRSLTAPVVVCWGAHLGWLHLEGTRIAFVGHPIALIVFTILACGELIMDKLPATPARTELPGLIARIVFGGCSGAALALSVAHASFVAAAIAGVIGALIATFAGYFIRHSLVTGAHLPDFPVALVEDVVAVAGGFLIVSHL